jgi:hypothetical protein
MNAAPLPVPTDYKSAERFLRNEDAGIKTAIVMDRGSDWLRVAIKGHHANGSEVVVTITGELPIAAVEDWEANFIETARAADGFWSGLKRQE